MRDAILEGPTSAEVLALARLARDPDANPPPHLCHDMREKGWLLTTNGGDYLITLTGRTLLEGR